MKKHIFFIIIFGSAVTVFLWKLLIMRGGFLYGDYSDQFYPWSMLYSESIKNFAFPFWTRYVQSGFPLMAEGQIGGFYPFHILFYFILPFRAAYNYITIAHFIMAGVFTYCYTSKLGACRWGSTLAAIIFCFGSAYAGCMVNTATLKAMAWFPLVLLLIEHYFDSRKPFVAGLAAIFLGIQMLSGASQAGVYAVLMSMVYFMTCLLSRGKVSIKDLGCFAGMPVIAFIIFLPQLLLTSELAGLSWRAGADLDFALSMSLSPVNFISLIFPRVIFHGVRVYSGVLSILFIIVSAMYVGKRKVFWPLLAVSFLSIFIALGSYNPLFVLILKALKFYDFRGPSKAILFFLFSMSTLSGVGFTVFFSDSSVYKRALKVFSVILSLSLILFFAARSVLVAFKDKIIWAGENIVRETVYGKPFHRYDLGTYMDKVKGFYESIVKNSSLSDPFIIFSVSFCLMLIAMAVYIYRKGNRRPVLRYFFISAILLELLVFSAYGTGFRGNILDFSSVGPGPSLIIDKMLKDKSLFRILPHDIASGKLPKYFLPSANAIYGIDSVALYTPLANEYYREELKDLEVVDNALGLETPGEGVLAKNIQLIRALNVKYIVSPHKFESPFLEFVVEDGGVSLYKVKNALPRAFISRYLGFSGIDDSVDVDVVNYSSGKASFRVTMPYDGFFVFSENRYPGWTARVNGQSSVIEPFSVVQFVKLEEGDNEVEFSYNPILSETMNRDKR